MAEKKARFNVERTSDIGKTLTKIRIESGLTLKDVAGILHRSESYVCKLETGDKIPSFDVLRSFAVACGVRPEKILAKVHQLELPLLSAIVSDGEVPESLPPDLTQQEIKELNQYLAFIRLRKEFSRDKPMVPGASE